MLARALVVVLAVVLVSSLVRDGVRMRVMVVSLGGEEKITNEC